MSELSCYWANAPRGVELELVANSTTPLTHDATCVDIHHPRWLVLWRDIKAGLQA